MSWNISVSLEAGYELDSLEIGIRFPAWASDISLLHRIQTSSAAPSFSYVLGIGTLSPGVKGQGLKLTTHLHLLPKLRMYSPICLHGIGLY
jgi:hypothetical protein